ncbi:MAG: Uma2 family endonuclease [Burkholderiales bacterium]|nr:Uma2 family endonuclease [Anaerolineae bacterium]
MSAIQIKRWTAEEYLAFERASDEKHEFLDGQIYSMTGASRAHNLISVNTATAFNNALRQHPCEVYASDMRVKAPSTKGGYLYPDVVVVCGEAAFEDQQVDTLLNPTVIVEVLSSSTESFDRGTKSQHYRALDSLQEYLLISQNTAHIEHYARRADGQWLLSDAVGLEAVVELRSVDCRLALADVYVKVAFEDESIDSGRNE